MSLKLLDLLFTGPFDPVQTVVKQNKAACVFAVISREGKPYNPSFRVIDIGDTAGEMVTFGDHPDLERWRAEGQGELGIYLYRPDVREPEASTVRARAVLALQQAYTPPTGTVAIDGSV